MAYLTCPWCLTPQLVADDVIQYQCFTCYGEIGFYPCPNCRTANTVSKKWKAFLCGRCGTKVELPHRWNYGVASKALSVRTTGKSWPPL